MGKTHLLHAVGHEYLRQAPRSNVLYMSAEKFMYEFVSAMRENDTIGFKQRLRSADLLLVDDVQFIAGKEATQEEFFYTINEIIGSGHRLVISADRPPHELGAVDKRIASRLAGGLVTDLRQPDLDHRRRIVAHKLAQMPQAEMPHDVADFLAQRFSNSIREMEGRADPGHRLFAPVEAADRSGFHAGNASGFASPLAAADHDRRDPALGL